jgi:hypothetical protein
MVHDHLSCKKSLIVSMGFEASSAGVSKTMSKKKKRSHHPIRLMEVSSVRVT